jgi:glyoxylase-like metal-dependent hydrolase (beta-lactamase superfamily II)
VIKREEVQQVADGIYRLGTDIHNFYVITEGGKATVVDAGCSKEFPKLKQGLASIGMKLDDVEAIILTHAHTDHIGFAAEANATGTEVRISDIEGPIATGDQVGDELKIRQLPLYKFGTWRFLIGLMKVGVTNAPRVKSVVTFEDGDVLDLPGSPMVVSSPGHTIGHACFYLPQHKTLLTGDALVTRDVLNHQDGAPQLMPCVFHTDPAQARASLDTLSALDTELVLPGHGSPYQGQIADAAKTALG